jgi:hypothetical protein
MGDRVGIRPKDAGHGIDHVDVRYDREQPSQHAELDRSIPRQPIPGREASPEGECDERVPDKHASW